mgnify:CR=1 FL=1|jgi:hypothetical protein|tara:strand:- start:589 stop:804 length:216 start_codon:yes stop_codon:yes gene_type:complete
MKNKIWKIKAHIEMIVKLEVEASCEWDAYDLFEKELEKGKDCVMEREVCLLDDTLETEDIEPDYSSEMNDE